jgi:glucan endo-1,3-beta-D-glucosidase
MDGPAPVSTPCEFYAENRAWIPSLLLVLTLARIQHGTQNTVIEAIQAAINTKTTLLLGMWCSAGQANFNNEIAALKAAISQYGTAFTDLVVGISVGSEDLYRVTPTSIENGGDVGAQPQEIVNYIKQTRDAIRGTPLNGKPIGHVGMST